MRGAIPPLPNTPSWGSVKAQGQQGKNWDILLTKENIRKRRRTSRGIRRKT